MPKPIYTLKNIAEYIGCKEDTARKMIKEGLKVARFGKEYVAVDVDLIKFIRSQYLPIEKVNECHSTSAANTGGSKSQPTGKRLGNLLEGKTNEKPKKSTTALKLVQD